MINDPLLPGSMPQDLPAPTAPPRSPSAPPSPRTRRRKAATSARILAVGMSTSGMFALTAGYSAAHQLPANDTIQPPSGTESATETGRTTAPASAQDPTGHAPAGHAPAATPTDAAPAPTPRIVQVPVEPAAPAVAGTTGRNTQQSSGSN